MRGYRKNPCHAVSGADCRSGTSGKMRGGRGCATEYQRKISEKSLLTDWRPCYKVSRVLAPCRKEKTARLEEFKLVSPMNFEGKTGIPETLRRTSTSDNFFTLLHASTAKFMY